MFKMTDVVNGGGQISVDVKDFKVESDNTESGVDLDTTGSDAQAPLNSTPRGSETSEKAPDNMDSDVEDQTTDRLLSVSEPEESGRETIIQPDQLYQAESGHEPNNKANQKSPLQTFLKRLRRKEFIVLLIGGFALLLGIILLAVSVGIRQCPAQQQGEKNSETQEHHHNHHHHTTGGDQHQDYVTGAYVSVIHNDDHNITKDEQPINLAEGNPATQSSTFTDGDKEYYAGLAVDGQSSHRFSNLTCSQTVWEQNPFWFTDLGKLQLVKTVKIIIPNDCCAGEMHNFEVRVGQQRDLSMNPLCQLHLGTALKISITIKCDRQLYGRYVSIQILGDETRRSNRLTLCEVMVYKD